MLKIKQMQEIQDLKLRGYSIVVVNRKVPKMSEKIPHLFFDNYLGNSPPDEDIPHDFLLSK